MNTLLQPYLNPLKFVELSPTEIPQYVSKHMDDHNFKDTVRSWEPPTCFLQPWAVADAVRLQYISNYSPLVLILKDVNHITKYSNQLDTLQQDQFRPGYYIRQSDLDLDPFDEGHYYAMIQGGGGPSPKTFVSEPFTIFENPVDTLLIEYSHYERYGDVIFAAPFSPSIRVPGILRFKTPASEDTMYRDQSYNQTMVKSVPYRVWELILAGKRGVPPWMIDKVNRILGCSDVKIDGRYYAKFAEDGQWEPVEADRYPMAGWKIDLVEKFNRSSTVFENDAAVIGMNSMMAVIDSKGFGMDDNGGDFLEIHDVN